MPVYKHTFKVVLFSNEVNFDLPIDEIDRFKPLAEIEDAINNEDSIGSVIHERTERIAKKNLPKEFEAIIDREKLKNKPHFQVEYDVNFYGGDYDDVGQFVYIPVCLIDIYGSEKKAFEQITGIDKRHIIHYSSDEYYDSEGNMLDEDEDEQTDD